MIHLYYIICCWFPLVLYFKFQLFYYSVQIGSFAYFLFVEVLTEFLYSFIFTENPYDCYFEFFIWLVTYLHFTSFFSTFVCCSFIWNIFLSHLILMDFLCLFLWIRWNSYFTQSCRTALCKSKLFVDYVCQVFLAGWLEPKWVSMVLESFCGSYGQDCSGHSLRDSRFQGCSGVLGGWLRLQQVLVKVTWGMLWRSGRMDRALGPKSCQRYLGREGT